MRDRYPNLKLAKSTETQNAGQNDESAEIVMSRELERISLEIMVKWGYETGYGAEVITVNIVIFVCKGGDKQRLQLVMPSVRRYYSNAFSGMNNGLKALEAFIRKVATTNEFKLIFSGKAADDLSEEEQKTVLKGTVIDVICLSAQSPLYYRIMISAL